MAVAFRAAGAVNQGTTGAVSIALPAGIAVNDILILVASTIAGETITITTTGGWTWNAVTGSPIDVTGGEKLYVWWARSVTGSETAPSITPGSDHSQGRIAAYSGCLETGSPINVQATGSETTSDTSFSFATGISTTVANCLVLCACSTGNDVSSTAQFGTMANTSLTALAERMDNATTNGGGGGFALAEGLRAAAGTCGTFTSTLATASAKAYIAFALRPQLKTLQTVTGSMPAPTGGLVRKISTKRTGVLAFAGTVIKKTRTLKAGVISFAGAVSRAKKTLKTITGGLSFAGAVTRVLTRKKLLAGVLSFAGAVRKWVKVKRTGTFSFTGVVSRVLTRKKLLTGVLSFTGAVKKKTRRVVTGSLTFTGTVVRKTYRKLAGALSFTGSVAGDLTAAILQTIAGVLSFSGTLAFKVSKRIGGALSFSGAIKRKTGKQLSGSLSFTGAVRRVTRRTLTGALSFEGTVRKATSRKLTGALSFVGSAVGSTIIVIRKTVGGVLSFSGSLRKVAGKRLYGALSFSGGVGKLIRKTLRGVLSAFGSPFGERIHLPIRARIVVAGRSPGIDASSFGGELVVRVRGSRVIAFGRVPILAVAGGAGAIFAKGRGE
jgi:hypothetical protein